MLSVVGREGVGAVTLLAREVDAEVDGVEGVAELGAGVVGLEGAGGDDRGSCLNCVDWLIERLEM